MTDYSEIRRSLHAHPQTAGSEQWAHDTVLHHLHQLHPDVIVEHVGGWGVVAVWGNDPTTPTIALRADTDALPIGHRCGHDGHTTILMRVAEMVDERRTRLHHNVLLLWQPAEETGEGARAVIESGVLQQYNIVGFYGMHNLPGYPLGTVVLCPHTFAAASTGVIYHLEGRPTHASTPELGLNPGLAVAEIVQAFAAFNNAARPFRQSSLIGIQLGAAAFGTSAGQADVMFTLRAFTNDVMDQLLREAHSVVQRIAERYSLRESHTLQEPFHATENHVAHVEIIEKAADEVPLLVSYRENPFRWSEDFSEYLMRWPGAFFGMGSGEQQPELHHPDYTFPDALILPASRLLLALVC